MSTLLAVDEARRELFCKKKKLWRIFLPLRMPFSSMKGELSFRQTFGLPVCRISRIFQDLKIGVGGCRRIVGSQIWMTLPEAARACNKLIRCGCKSTRGCSTQCKCAKAGLSCNDLCSCTCKIIHTIAAWYVFLMIQFSLQSISPITDASFSL